MKKLIVAALALGFGLSLAQTAPKIDGVIAAKEYANSYKHNASGMTINWQVMGDTIYFGLDSAATGWVGIGFNPTGDKKEGADMYMFLFEGGKLVARDEVMTKTTGAPKQDTDEGGKNDILASAGKASDKGMVIEFSRKLNTGDKNDQPIVLGKPTKVLLAEADDASFTKAHKRGERWEFEVTFK